MQSSSQPPRSVLEANVAETGFSLNAGNQGVLLVIFVSTILPPQSSAASAPSSTPWHKPLTSTGPYRFLSLSNRGPSRRSDGTGFVIRSSPMTSQVEVELPTFTIAPLERSSELYWKLDADNIEHGHGYALHQSVAHAESSMSMIEEGHVRGFCEGGSWCTFH